MKRFLQLGIFSEIAAIIFIIQILLSKISFQSITNQIKNVDIHSIGLVSAYIGAGTFIAVLMFLILKFIFKLKKPQKSVVDLVAPFLLPKEELGKSDYGLNLFLYYMIIFSNVLSAIGLSIILIKLFF